MFIKKIKNLFSSKRDKSEYLKFEDGNIISVDKVSKLDKSDKAPRLDIHKDNEIIEDPLQGSDIEPESKENGKKKITDKFLIYIILAFLVTFGIYLFDLSKVFMNKTSDYMNTGKITDFQKQPDTDTKPTNNGSKGSNTGSLGNTQLDVIPEPTKKNNKLIDLLQLVVQSNNTIQTNYLKVKTEVIYYADSKSTKYILNSSLNKIKSNTEKSYTNLLQYESDFTTAGMKLLYDIQIERLNNLNILVDKVEKIEGRSEVISIANNHIVKENDLVNKQIDAFIDILKKNDIPYTNKDGNISYILK